jgi:hypothetical protein
VHLLSYVADRQAQHRLPRQISGKRDENDKKDDQRRS